jgi:pilus assembly protein Flp/PilA
MRDLAMNKLTQKIRHFLREEEGLTMVEYAVAGSLLVLAVGTIFTDLGTAIKNGISTIINNIGGGSTGQ